jgi:hypothetical protein
MPWEKIHKVSIATMTVNMALDLESPSANENGTRLEAVTKDQLNTGLTGQIRYRVSEANLYAFLFGIKKPFVHVMAYFVSVLRQRIANFEAKPLPFAEAAASAAAPVAGSGWLECRSTIYERISAISTSTWTTSAARRRRGTASFWTRR